jgi:small subunit ribosomal protein S1
MIDGVRAFCPVSQIDRKYSSNDADYLNKRFLFTVTEIKSRDCIVSRRTLIERESRAAEETLKGKVSVGDIVKGKVTRIAEFGIFVDFGGIDGLVPRSELARSRSVSPEQFSVGTEVSVKIMSIDWAAKKFSLSIKETEKDPWDKPAVSEGTEYKGTVTNIIKGGAFVEVLPGLEGFIPLSKMSYTKRVMNAEDIVTRGDEVSVKLISLDLKERRMTLELITGEVDPWSGSATPVSEDIIEGKVESVKSAGVVVRLPNGMEGFLPRREIICDRNTDLDKMFKTGDTVKVVTKELKKEERRMILSQKEIESREERESMKQYMKRESESADESSLGSQFSGMFSDLKKKMGE